MYGNLIIVHDRLKHFFDLIHFWKYIPIVQNNSQALTQLYYYNVRMLTKYVNLIAPSADSIKNKIVCVCMCVKSMESTISKMKC